MDAVATLRPAHDTPWLAPLRAPRRVVTRGDALFRQGDEARTVYVVLAGAFALRAANPDGDETTVDLAQRDELLGEEAVLRSRPLRVTTAVAVTRSVVAVIHLGAYSPTALETVVGLGARVLQERMATLTTRLVDQRQVDADGRVVRRTAELSVGHDQLFCTQSDVAQMAGTSRATANRVLVELQDAGLLRLGRSTITILDRHGLAVRAGSAPLIAAAS
jgi:CRP-like cAMP-binding protein